MLNFLLCYDKSLLLINEKKINDKKDNSKSSESLIDLHVKVFLKMGCAHLQKYE